MASKNVSIEKDLECPICLDVFKDPKYLSCLHTFCRECIERTSDGDTDVVCPECRQPTVLDEKLRTLGLKPNIVAGRLVDTLNALKASRGGEAESLKSADGHHMCSIHERYRRKYYCKRCRALICSECSMERHYDHASDVSPADVMVEERRSSIKSFLESSEDQLRQTEETQKFIKQRSEADVRLIDDASEIKLRVDKSFDAIRYQTREMLEQLGSVTLRQDRLVNRRVAINQLGRDLLETGHEEELITMYGEWSDAAEEVSALQTSPETSRSIEVISDADDRCSKEVDECLLYLKELTTSLRELKKRGTNLSPWLIELVSNLNVGEKKQNRRTLENNNNKIFARENKSVHDPDPQFFASMESHTSPGSHHLQHHSSLLLSRTMPLSPLDAPPSHSDMTGSGEHQSAAAAPKWSEDDPVWVGARDDGAIPRPTRSSTAARSSPSTAVQSSPTSLTQATPPTAFGSIQHLRHAASAPGPSSIVAAKQTQFSHGALQDSPDVHPSASPVDEGIAISDGPLKCSEDKSQWSSRPTASAPTSQPHPRVSYYPAAAKTNQVLLRQGAIQERSNSRPSAPLPSSISDVHVNEGAASCDAPPKWSEDESMWGATSSTSPKPPLQHSISAPMYTSTDQPPGLDNSIKPRLSHSASFPEHTAANPPPSNQGNAPIVYPLGDCYRPIGYPGYPAPTLQYPAGPQPTQSYQMPTPEMASAPYQPLVITYPTSVRTAIRPARAVNKRGTRARPRRR